jgi:bifunctional non-homologous end joining protein LigD
MKFDGYRLIVRKEGRQVRLFTRSGLDWTSKFKTVADHIAKLRTTAALLDGEAVVTNEEGVSSFGALQQALSEGTHERIKLYLFDALFIGRRDLRQEPLEVRKARLKQLLDRSEDNGRILYSDHFDAPGADVHRSACDLGLEGIISKRRGAPYRSGRVGDWLKVKCKKGQEFVIAGYKLSDKGKAFRSLLLGTYENGRLTYAGHVGTGFTNKVAADLLLRMQSLRTDERTMENVPRADQRRAVWVKPTLVAEVQFTERTSDGELRHPSFKGLRADKKAEEVHLERPVQPRRVSGIAGIKAEKFDTRSK